VVVFLAGAKSRPARQPFYWTATPAPSDRFTFAEPQKIQTSHVALDLTVDFAQRKLAGTATLTLVHRTPTNVLMLDSAGLDITRVTCDAAPCTHSFADSNSNGEALKIDITPSTRFVTIDYSTGTNAGALHWNTAAQTYGRVQPFLYTQNEPVDARSWIPVQDTPSVRMTYEATIRVPSGLMAVMSAGSNPRAVHPDGVYRFAMHQPIPAYLIALAVGRLEYHAFDERTGVYAEPELMDAAKWELQYMPEMLRAAERIVGPHPFPLHNVVLMPPTYIVGGMEHPMLNFINPFSAVSGNHPARPEPKSLMAHELAHSWAGDATTLATWSDVWLNEGITSYLTLRILDEMGEEERVEHAYFNDRRGFENYVRTAPDPSWTTMHYDVAHPGIGFGSQSYTKGELFMRMLEEELGRERLDEFLRAYFAKHLFRWASDQSFLEALRDFAGTAAIEKARVNEWIYSPGLPMNFAAGTRSDIFDRTQFRVAEINNGASMASLAPQTWLDVETELFLQTLPRSTFRARASEIDAALGLSLRPAPPTSFLLAAIATDYAPANAGVERVLMRGGGNSTIIALYNALAMTHAGRQRANEIFSRARDRYHASVAAQVEKLLSAASAERDAA
jgi:leukotriene-A4 hydrolase